MAEYIEREAAVAAVVEAVDNGWAVMSADLGEIIDDLPASDVAPVRHGHWIMRGGKRFCSECKVRACVTRDMEDFWYMKGTDYCPNCGAKMDGEMG